jgi:transcriptional regulator of acetoin/glycerol metabolism
MRIALKYAVRFKECDSIVLERLISYKWPGNIRELQNVMERLYALCTGSEIKYDDLPSNIRDQREDERILGNPAPRIELKNFDFYNANHMALLKEVLIRLKGNGRGAGRCLADEYGFGNMNSGASIKNRAGLDKSNIHLTIVNF